MQAAARGLSVRAPARRQREQLWREVRMRQQFAAAVDVQRMYRGVRGRREAAATVAKLDADRLEWTELRNGNPNPNPTPTPDLTPDPSLTLTLTLALALALT